MAATVAGERTQPALQKPQTQIVTCGYNARAASRNGLASLVYTLRSDALYVRATPTILPPSLTLPLCCVLIPRPRHVTRDRLQELAEQLECGREGTLDEKLGSALDLTHALNENGEYSDAVNLGKQTLATFREVAQPDDPNLLHALGMLAHAYASFVAFVLCHHHQTT